MPMQIAESPDESDSIPKSPGGLTLNYAPRRWLSLRHWRVLFTLGILLPILVLRWLWGATAWHYVVYRSTWYRCASLSLSPDKVVYEENPERARALLASPNI